MDPSPHAVLVEVVERYDESAGPVSPHVVADSLDAPESAVSDRCESLCEFDLLYPEATGYRPTVTARELLALDIDLGDAVALDVVSE
jgi:predicted transcriptional regulator